MNARTRGFTILELMIVIGIVALLMTLGIPAYHNIKNRAHAAVCSANLRDVGTALNAYLTDHSMTMPKLVAGRASKSEEVPVIDTVLAEYVSDARFFRCPGDHQGIYEETGTSYFWNQLLNGQNAYSLKFFLTSGDFGIPVVCDKEKFHPGIGDEVNILYADGHVDREVRFFSE